jgi:pyrrolidone-carboxylate peptidase
MLLHNLTLVGREMPHIPGIEKNLSVHQNSIPLIFSNHLHKFLCNFHLYRIRNIIQSNTEPFS